MFVTNLAKKKNKKGKTLTLTDFLAEDSSGGGGGNVAPSYPSKSTSWADETDDLDGDGKLNLKYSFTLRCCIFPCKRVHWSFFSTT